METKKFLLASAAASGVLATGGLVWHGLMRGFYKGSPRKGLRRKRPSLTIDALARVIYGIGLAASYPRPRSNAKSPTGRGFRTGVLVGGIASLPSSLSDLGGHRVNLRAAMATAGFETLLGGIAGAVVGSIYGDRPRRVYEDISGYVEIDREPTEGPIQDEDRVAEMQRQNGGI